MKAVCSKYTLQFKRPSGTSRGVLHTKDSWFIRIIDPEQPGRVGWGECGVLAGLSVDDAATYETKLAEACARISVGTSLLDELVDYPSIRFGVEMALRSWEQAKPFRLFDTPFSRGETGQWINGLIWMGEPDFMHRQIEEKLATGFRCIKLKIGAIDFEQELLLLRGIRDRFPADVIELRVDANGAFTPEDAMRKLEQLAQFDLHSIEQPIRQGQWEEMARLCANTPLPIALDEELIGIHDPQQQEALIRTIQPQYLILKPSLLGGWSASQRWIHLADTNDAGWWVTSALESNIGLNAIAQWTATLGNTMPQGLGTGQLYTNNVPSPLEVIGEELWYRSGEEWDVGLLSI